MGNKKQNQTTEAQKDENAQGQPAENQQTENPAQNGGGNGDVQPSATPPANADANGGNDDSTPTVTPPAGEKDGSEEQPEGGGSQPTVTQPVASDADTGNGDGAPTDTPAAGGADDKDSKTKDKKVKLTLRHKSHTQHYFRCGLMLTKVFAEYEVSKEAVAKIKADKWIEIKDCK